MMPSPTDNFSKKDNFNNSFNTSGSTSDYKDIQGGGGEVVDQLQEEPDQNQQEEAHKSPSPNIKIRNKNFRPDTLDLLNAHCKQVKSSSPVRLSGVVVEGPFDNAMSNKISPLVESTVNHHSESGIYSNSNSIEIDYKHRSDAVDNVTYIENLIKCQAEQEDQFRTPTKNTDGANLNSTTSSDTTADDVEEPGKGEGEQDQSEDQTENEESNSQELHSAGSVTTPKGPKHDQLSQKSASLPMDTLKVKTSPSTPTSPSRRAFALLAKFLNLPRKKFNSISSNGTNNSRERELRDSSGDGDRLSLASKTPSAFGLKADRFIGKLASASGGILGGASGGLGSIQSAGKNLPTYPVYISACLYGTVPVDCITHFNMSDQYFPKSKENSPARMSPGKRKRVSDARIIREAGDEKDLQSAKENRNPQASSTGFLNNRQQSSASEFKDKSNESQPLIERAASATVEVQGGTGGSPGAGKTTSSLSINFNPEIYPEKYASRFLKIPPEEHDIVDAVKLPSFVGEQEWVATQMLSLFKNVFTIYDTISSKCLPRNADCREMKGVNNEKYYRDLFKNTQDLTHAPRYIQWVYERCTEIIADQGIFPTKYGEEFSEDFNRQMGVMARWLYSIISHMYHAHFIHLLQLDNLHLYLNQVLAHLVLFTDEFGILTAKERRSLSDLIKFLTPKGSLKENASTLSESQNCNQYNSNSAMFINGSSQRPGHSSTPSGLASLSEAYANSCLDQTSSSKFNNIKSSSVGTETRRPGIIGQNSVFESDPEGGSPLAEGLPDSGRREGQRQL